MRIPGFIICFLAISTATAQTKTEQAAAKAEEAYKLMQDGKFTASVILLEDAARLDPESIVYPYEMALARYQMKDYNGALSILKKLTKNKHCDAYVYHLLGNTYDDMGKPEKAIDTYDKGIALFPAGGMLYLERGIMEMKKEQYDNALKYFENGILAAPMYPSNYYRAAQLFLDSDQEVWGMIYGEIFMNLERGTKRTEEMSRQLYYTYKGEIKFTSDTSWSVSFCKNNQTIYLNVNGKKADRMKGLMEQMTAVLSLSYGNEYEATLSKAVAGEEIINLASLGRIRNRFLDIYEADSLQYKYPVVLFDFQRKVRDAGHLEAYNYWVLGQADDKEVSTWISDHKQQWDDFIKWYQDNKMEITKETVFQRLKLRVAL